MDRVGDSSKPAALAAVQGVIAIVSAITLFSGAVNSSVIVAINTVGVIGFFGLILGMGAWWSGDRPSDQLSRIRRTGWVVAISSVISGLLYTFGGNLGSEEKKPNFATVMGVISILALATLTTLAWREIQKAAQPAKKKCPDCAEMVLKDARKCKHCEHMFE